MTEGFRILWVFAYAVAATARLLQPVKAFERRDAEAMEDLVPIPGVLLERLVALGVDVARILERAGISRADLESPRGRVTTASASSSWVHMNV